MKASDIGWEKFKGEFHYDNGTAFIRDELRVEDIKTLNIPFMIVQPTSDEIIEVMTANGIDEEIAKIFAYCIDDEELKHKALMSDGMLYDIEVTRNDPLPYYGKKGYKVKMEDHNENI